ncbi:MAG: dihydroorotate dehydrogenase electron transfer subunit [Endomicrobium sp.]|jgi:dihydroorotate dehydrogenase electron transfer subunit|nr:dihydroorotate dehydrogenase electron transfer subunit [Endomicrobium sp.]
MNKKFDKNYKIISNVKVHGNYFELKIKAPITVKHCHPGQFFMLSIPNVFLRRPISIHNIKKNTIIFLYKVIGDGTRNLSKIKSGKIQLLGPLGNSYYDLNFVPSSQKINNKSCNFSPIIIAGGTGIVSLYFLAINLNTRGTIYYGVYSEKDLLCLEKFKKIGWKIIISTEDGSQGYKGYITDILHKDLRNDNTLFVCGPASMLKKVSQIAKEKNINGFASLEEKMACGIGNCQGCVVKVKGQNKRVCRDGTIFRIEDIDL